MSTKKLSRTILEGGRYNKYERRSSSGEERAKIRAYLSEIRKDPEAAEEVFEPVRTKVSPMFTDKLAPVYRYLDKQVGKSWPNVFKGLKEKFDSRTLAGFHVLDQHIMDSIGTESEENEVDFSRNYYYVDSNNIFRKSDYYGYKKRYSIFTSTPTYISIQQRDEIVAWLDGRKVGFVGGVLYWFEPTASDVTVSWPAYRKWPVFGFHTYRPNVQINFRQGKKLLKEDVNYFRSLPEHIREGLLKIAPNKKEDVA